MHRQLLKALPIVAASVALTAGCLFGGGDQPASVSRPGSIPTATPPSRLPDPLVLGDMQPTGPQPSATGAQTYVLKSGDTLLALATQFGIAPAQQQAWVVEVLRLNGVQDATLLKAGQELRLPTPQPTPRVTGTVQATTGARTPTAAGTTPAATAAVATATPRPTVTASAGGTYTVVSGDYPLLIAAKLGVPEADQLNWANQLIALNNINATGLQIGQVVQLPPGTSGGVAIATATRTP